LKLNEKLLLQRTRHLAEVNPYRAGNQQMVRTIAEREAILNRDGNAGLAWLPAIKWASDGGAFDYVENGVSGAKIWRQALEEKSPPKLLLHLPGTEIYNFVWSSDGKKIWR
jgi:hypothetical protein